MTEFSATMVRQEQARPNPDLANLDRLVGTWRLTGGTEGICSYEWMEGGFFLAQHIDLEQYGQKIKGLEIIGHWHPFGEEPDKEIRSRFYSFFDGMTLDYVYELRGDTLTIWGGERGSPAYYQGKFSDDGDTVAGAWVYPDGGGYESVSTRIKRDLVVTRVLHAPVERVWQALTDPQQVMRWWGPKEFTTPIADMDVREGGKSLICMRSPDGQYFCDAWTIHKVVPMQRLEFTDTLVDRDGNKINPESIGLHPDLQDLRIVTTLKPMGDNQTELTITQHGHPAGQAYDLTRAGLNESLDKLEDSLKQG
jgi:uncharacterized protein YndB with AHSA1/START domain